MRRKRKWGVLLLVIALAALCCTSVFAEEGDPAATSGWGLLSGESLKETFMSLLTGAIGDFFSGIVNALIGFVDGLMMDMLAVAFHVENLFGKISGTTSISTQALHNTYNFIYTVACALVTLKFIFKGFQIYVLWRDGDADASPRDMLVGAIEAAVVMAIFPWLYERAVDVFIYFANGVMGTLGGASFHAGLGELALTALPASWGAMLVTLIFILIFFVLTFVLWIRLIRQGLELLILRLGVPLATLGLVDSDAALFKNYIQVFLKTALTVIIQLTLMSLAFRVIVSFDILGALVSIAIMSTALSTPRLMQQFLVPQGGGGGLAQKAYSISMVARAGKMFFH